MSTDKELNAAIESLTAKFTSSNSVTVTQATILREEFDAIKGLASQSEWVSAKTLPEDNAEVVVRMVDKHGHVKYDHCTYVGVFPFVEINWGKREQTCPVTHWTYQPPKDTNK